jgi:hypothetical protein
MEEVDAFITVLQMDRIGTDNEELVTTILFLLRPF